MRYITTAILALVALPAWASYDGWANGDYLSGTFGTGFNVPLSIVAWVNCDATGWADTATDYVVEINDDRTDANDSYRLFRGTAADTVAAGTVASGGGSNNPSFSFTDGTYDDTWVMIAAVYASSSSRVVYIENSSQTASNGATRTTVSVAELTVGADFSGSANFLPSSCKVAEVAVFDVALSTTNIDDLQTAAETGPSPCSVDPTNCIAYWSLSSDQATHSDESGNGGPSLSENGTITFNADHPTIESGVCLPCMQYYLQQQNN